MSNYLCPNCGYSFGEHVPELCPACYQIIPEDKCTIPVAIPLVLYSGKCKECGAEGVNVLDLCNNCWRKEPMEIQDDEYEDSNYIEQSQYDWNKDRESWELQVSILTNMVKDKEDHIRKLEDEVNEDLEAKDNTILELEEEIHKSEGERVRLHKINTDLYHTCYMVSVLSGTYFLFSLYLLLWR